MKHLFTVIFLILVVSCSNDQENEQLNSNDSYLTKFFCRNMNSLAINTYRSHLNHLENSEIRLIVEEIISDANELDKLKEHSKIVLLLMDSLIVKKGYFLDSYDLGDKIEMAKHDIKSKNFGQLYNGLFVAMEIIVTLSFMDFCGFGLDRLGLFVTDSITLDSNRLYEFDFDIRPIHSKMVYYNTYSRNDSINKTKILIDTRNIDADEFVQNISASIINPVTLERKTYETPILVRIRK